MNRMFKRTPPTTTETVAALLTVPNELAARVVLSSAVVAAERLTVARERMLAVAARVEPTPTYDAVVEVLGWNPRTDLT